jgi:hypothetical protein
MRKHGVALAVLLGAAGCSGSGPGPEVGVRFLLFLPDVAEFGADPSLRLEVEVPGEPPFTKDFGVMPCPGGMPIEVTLPTQFLCAGHGKADGYRLTREGDALVVWRYNKSKAPKSSARDEDQSHYFPDEVFRHPLPPRATIKMLP